MYVYKYMHTCACLGVYVYVCLYVCPSKHDLHENAETMDRGKVQTERAQHENAETMDRGKAQTESVQHENAETMDSGLYTSCCSIQREPDMTTKKP